MSRALTVATLFPLATVAAADEANATALVRRGAARGLGVETVTVDRPEAFTAADKLTKKAWLIILGIALAATILIWNPIFIINLVGAVAAIVYLVDVRPALRSLRRR